MNLQETAEVIEELRRRSEHKRYQYVPGEISGWDQVSFHKSQARYRMLFGGNRSGKSFAAAYEISCWLIGKHPYRTIPQPPNLIWVISPEYSIIETGIYEHLKDLIPSWEVQQIGPKIPQQNLPSFILLKNGSKVVFKSAKGDSAAREKFQAAAVDLISIDEEIREDIWTELEMRTLDRGGQFIFSATLVESYDWLVDLEERAESPDSDYFLSRLETEKNPHLDKITVSKVKAKLSQDDIDVRFLGKARRGRGLVYNNFTEKNVIEPFEIPRDWPRWCAIDPGIRTFAVLWIAIGPDEKAYAYREIYVHNEPLWQMARSIMYAEGWKNNTALEEQFHHFVWEETEDTEQIIARLIDPSSISRMITGESSIIDQLNNNFGLLCLQADNSLRPGIEACRYWIEHKFHVFRTLENFIWEVKRYRIRDYITGKNQGEPIDVPIKKADHLMDCFRYTAMEKPAWEARRLLQPMQFSQRDVNRHVRKQDEYVHEYLGSVW